MGMNVIFPSEVFLMFLVMMFQCYLDFLLLVYLVSHFSLHSITCLDGLGGGRMYQGCSNTDKKCSVHNSFYPVLLIISDWTSKLSFTRRVEVTTNTSYCQVIYPTVKTVSPLITWLSARCHNGVVPDGLYLGQCRGVYCSLSPVEIQSKVDLADMKLFSLWNWIREESTRCTWRWLVVLIFALNPKKKRNLFCHG